MPLPDLFTDSPVHDNDYSDINPDVIRTIMGEGDPASVASVLKNRKDKSGLDYGTLVTDPTQFAARTGDAWDKNSKISTDSPEYQKALKIAGPILAGDRDPVTKADSFYSPTGMKSGAKPQWDDGSGTAGPDGQLYFTDKYSPPKLPNLFGNSPNSAADPEVTNAVTGEPLPDYQARKARELQAEPNGLVTDSKSGTATYKGMPLYQTTGDEQPQKPGDYWIDQAGALHQVPTQYNASVSFANGVLGGYGNNLMAGVSALKAAGGNPADPMFGDYYHQALSHFQDAQQSYTQQHPITAGITQGLGNLTTAAPAMALGGEALAPVRAALGPTGEFLAGASKGNAFLRGGSVAANGALQGAAVGGLDSGQSDEPLQDQVLQGAAGGAIANPLIHAVGSVAANHFFPSVSQPVADLAKAAIDKFGINLDGAQILGAENPTAAARYAKLAATPGSDTAATAQSNLDNRMRAISNTFGEDDATLTQPRLQAAQKRIGDTMNDVAFRNNITNVQGLNDGLDVVMSQAKLGGLSAPEQKQLQTLVGTVKRNINQGQMTGSAYKGLISKDSPLYDAMQDSSSNINLYARRIKDILDGAFDAETNSADVGVMPKARAQYGNLMNVQGLVDAKGKVPVGALDSVVNQNGRLYNSGDLGQLNDIDTLFMNHKAPAPNSILGHAINLAGVTGAGVGAAFLQHNPLAVGEALTGATALAAGRHYLGTPISEALNNSEYLKNRLLQGANAPKPGQVPYYLTSAATIGAQNLFQLQQGTK